jgi:hypothetical protein
MIKVDKKAPLYSGMVGVSPERADEMFAILLVATTFKAKEAIGRSGTYTDGMLISDVLEEALSRIDQNKPEELFYMGFKFQEWCSMSIKKGFGSSIDVVVAVMRDDDTFEEAVKQVIKVIDKKK